MITLLLVYANIILTLACYIIR